MAEFVPVGTFDIVIFGATGDLTERKLLPALFHRWLDGQIPAESRIIGSARTDMSRDEFRGFAKKACQRSAGDTWDEGTWSAFSALLDYVAMDATKADAPWEALNSALSGEAGRPCVFYLATAPRLYVQICEALGRAGLNGADARVVLEKPIGTDLASARAINDGVARQRNCAEFDGAAVCKCFV